MQHGQQDDGATVRQEKVPRPGDSSSSRSPQATNDNLATTFNSGQSDDSSFASLIVENDDRFSLQGTTGETRRAYCSSDLDAKAAAPRSATVGLVAVGRASLPSEDNELSGQEPLPLVGSPIQAKEVIGGGDDGALPLFETDEDFRAKRRARRISSTPTAALRTTPSPTKSGGVLAAAKLAAISPARRSTPTAAPQTTSSLTKSGGVLAAAKLAAHRNDIRAKHQTKRIDGSSTPIPQTNSDGVIAADNSASSNDDIRAEHETKRIAGRSAENSQSGSDSVIATDKSSKRNDTTGCDGLDLMEDRPSATRRQQSIGDNPPNTFTPVAEPVMQEEIVDATHVMPFHHEDPDDNDKTFAHTKTNRCFWIILAAAVLLVVVVVIVVVVLLVPRDPSTGGTTRTLSPEERLQRLGQLLQPVSGDALFRNDTFQFRALSWLATQDDADLDIENTPTQVLTERYILALLYFANNGTQWFSQFDFLSPASVCQWNSGDLNVSNDLQPDGVFCDSDGAVRFLDMGGMNIAGRLPTEMRHLSRLAFLWLDKNAITGSLSIEYFQFPQLKRFSMNRNLLTGTIPTEVGMLAPTLEHLWLGGNQLEGTIPTEVGSLTKLVRLSFGNNMVTGTIPTEVGNLPDLATVFFNGNTLNGTLPTEMGKLRSLEVAWLQGNSLTGNVPTELGSLSNLATLALASNQVVGDLDSIFCNENRTFDRLTADHCKPEVICGCCTNNC